MRKSNSWYYLIPLVLFWVQLIFTVNSLGIIRQEELSESISYPFWLQERIICNGITTQLGWYLPLMFFYKVFGFGLFTARYLRLILQLFSLLALAAIFRRYLGKFAWLPLLVIGLSPTMLYFNTLAVSYGLDLQIFPICLWLLLFADFKKTLGILKLALSWTVAMVTWMSYPTFLYYLPVLALVTHTTYKSNKTNRSYLVIVAAAVSFLAPLILAFLYVKNRSVLIYDPVTHSGIFRANGHLSLDFKTFLDNLKILKYDLFSRSVSYYFEVGAVEFSNFYPIIAIFCVFFASFLLFLKVKRLRKIIAVLFLAIPAVLLLSNVTGELGGIRRSTELLFLFYTLFGFGWYFVRSSKINKSLKIILTAGFFLILVHHIIVIPANIGSLRNDRKFSEGQWFSAVQTPQQSLDMFVQQIQKSDLSLICVDQSQKPASCGGYEYNLIYPAIFGACQWNDLLCHKIEAYDFEKGRVASLKLDCWDRSSFY